MLGTYARLLLAAPQSLSQSQTIHPPLSSSQRHLLQAQPPTHCPTYPHPLNHRPHWRFLPPARVPF